MAAYRQYFISDPTTWSQNLHVWCPGSGSQWLHLINYTTDQATLDKLWGTDQASWAKLPEVVAWQASGSPILISGGISQEAHAEQWHGNPNVVIMQHSTYERVVTFGDLVSNAQYAHKKFKQSHLDLLTSLYGIKSTSCVWDLHAAVKAQHPGVKLTRPF